MDVKPAPPAAMDDSAARWEWRWSTPLQTAVFLWLGSCLLSTVATHTANEGSKQLFLTVIVTSVICCISFHSRDSGPFQWLCICIEGYHEYLNAIFCMRETFAFCLTFAIFGSSFQPLPVLSSYVRAVQPHWEHQQMLTCLLHTRVSVRTSVERLCPANFSTRAATFCSLHCIPLYAVPWQHTYYTVQY